MSACGKMKKEYYWRSEMIIEEAAIKRSSGIKIIEKLRERDKEVQEQEVQEY